ncbi:MAG: RIP metalloprotease RseP, partial [Gemmatimonadales bacterium]
MFLTILSAVVVLGVLIFVHELGHFIAAKAVGIGVPRFSIGLGPATPLRYQRGETEYVVSWIPFGGYVKMATREEQELLEDVEGGKTEPDFPTEKLFESKPLWARMFAISAGVLMNALFAWFVYSALAVVYGRVEDPIVRVAAVDSALLPAEAGALAGLPFGTRIVAINSDTMGSWTAIQAAVSNPTSQQLLFEFDEGVPDIAVPIPGLRTEERLAVLQSIKPLRAARVGVVLPDNPAYDAGFETRDLVLFVNGDSIRYWDQMVTIVEANVDREIDFVVLRGGERMTLAVTPAAMEVSDPMTGATVVRGRIGIGYWLEPRRVRYGAVASIGVGLRRTEEDALVVWTALKGWVTGQLSPRELGGPILIGQLSGQFARIGFEA